jgi:hypothetical protein
MRRLQHKLNYFYFAKKIQKSNHVVEIFKNLDCKNVEIEPWPSIDKHINWE